ncbi:hypothetical protein V8E51_012089 [Hyaloscypha variabilis]
MATKFLFINEDQVSYVHRPRGVPSLVRGHARKYRPNRIGRSAYRPSSTRKIWPRESESSITKDQMILPSEHGEETERRTDMLTGRHYTTGVNPSQPLHYRILQLDCQTRRLIQFYLLWNVSQAHSSLECALSWPKTIVATAFNSELHSLVLPCYIASLVSYLSQKLSKPQRKSFQSNSRANTPESYFDSDSPQSSKSPPTSRRPVVPQTADPPPFGFPPTYSWDAWDTWQDSQAPHIPRPSSVQASPTLHPAAPRTPRPAPKRDVALSRSLSCPSQSCNDTLPPVPPDLLQLTHLALEALQSRLSTKNKSSLSSSFSTDLLFPVWCLFRAAIFQSDEFAAVSHQRFLRHLVYRADCAKYCSSWLVDVITEVDLGLCLSRQGMGGGDRGSSALLVMSELRERMAEGP